MTGRVLLVLGLLWPASSFPMAGKVQENVSASQVVHEVELIDPLQPSEPKRTYPLRLSFDGNRFPDEYSLPLNAEVCMEQVCNSVDVTLVWDALGRYRRLEVAQSAPLTKLEHVPFNPEDYARLDEILGNGRSILGTYPVGFFQELKSGKDEVDGVTSATPIAVRSAVVEGAAYSSWVLWHWVNGEVEGKMRALTAQYASPDYIQHGLQSNDPDFVRFALRYLNEGSVPKKILDRWLVELIGKNPTSSRLIVQYFKTQRELDPTLRRQLAERLDRLPPYDLYAVLNLLEGDEATRVQVEKLLDSDNAYVVQCAEGFLDRTDAE